MVRSIRHYISYHTPPKIFLFIEAETCVEAQFKFKALINSTIIKDRLVYFQNIETPIFRISKSTDTELQYSDFTLDKMNDDLRLKHSKTLEVVI